MTMPLRPARVAGGLRLRLATSFMTWVSDGSCGGSPASRLTRTCPVATALIASVSESFSRSTSAVRAFAVARPERFEERRDFLGCRAIPVRLRNAATASEPHGVGRQLAQALAHDLQLVAVRVARHLLDGVLVAARRYRIHHHYALGPRLREFHHA